MEANPGTLRPIPAVAEYSVVMYWACPGTSVTCQWHRLSMSYCCSERLWSQIFFT